MNKWIAEFDLEDGDIMPEHMDLEYKGVKIDFHCRPLEQEPTTKNDLGVDCVSRDEVCRYVAEFVNHEFSTREEEELIDNIITGIERMPPVTPIRPKGHWIRDKREQDAYHCSNCDWVIRTSELFEKPTEWNKFCAMCGADMREVLEDGKNK